MEEIELTRRDQGKIAEKLAEGLYNPPSDQVVAKVERHVETEYSDLFDGNRFYVKPASVNSYQWMDQLHQHFPGDLEWRPDVILKVEWTLTRPRGEPFAPEFWERNPPAYDHQAKEERFRCECTVEETGTTTYYCDPHEAIGMKGGIHVA